MGGVPLVAAENGKRAPSAQMESAGVQRPASRTLDLGCSRYKFPGAIGVDRQAWPEVDVVCDLDHYPWPFPDNTFDRILCRHVLAHLSNVVKAMEEIHRILRPGGRVQIVTPHFSSDNAFVDITSRWFFGFRSLDYFCVNRDCKYQYSLKQFRLLEVRISFRQAHAFADEKEQFNPLALIGLEWFINKVPRTYEHFLAFTIRANEVYFSLEPIKQAPGISEEDTETLALIEGPHSGLFDLLRETAYLVRRDGVRTFLRRLVTFSGRFLCATRRYLVFKKACYTNAPCASPPDTTLCIISADTNIAGMPRDGYDFGYLTVPQIQRYRRAGNVLFSIFRDKRLVHSSWVSLRHNSQLDVFCSHADYRSCVYVGDCYTIPSARGLGLYRYALAEICRWAPTTGRGTAMLTVEEDNRPSISAITAAGFRKIGQAQATRLLGLRVLRFSGTVRGVWSRPEKARVEDGGE